MAVPEGDCHGPDAESAGGSGGPKAKGLSASVIGRLKRKWEAEYADWCRRVLSRERWVYWWADGIYSGLRAKRQKLCVLVIIGVDVRGEKRFNSARP